jgi:hypothetical protein
VGKLQIAARFDAETVTRISKLAHESGRTLTDQVRYLARLGLSVSEIKARCIEAADDYDRRAAAFRMRQARIVPEPQLSKLKSQHWRILATMLEKAEAEA